MHGKAASKFNAVTLGLFAVAGTEGLKEGLLPHTIPLHREHMTTDTPEEFQRRLPVGRRLDIWATTEYRSQEEGTTTLVTEDTIETLISPNPRNLGTGIGRERR